MSNILIFTIIFAGIWALIGVVFLIIGIAMYNNRRKKEVNCTSSTFGKVTDIVQHQSYNKNGEFISWHPVLEYSIGELKFKKESPYGSSQSKYAIGQNIEIYFNPDNYNEYYIAGDNLPTKLAKFFTFIGIGAIVVALTSAILIISLFN